MSGEVRGGGRYQGRRAFHIFHEAEKCIGFILLVCDLDNVHISSSGPLFYESWAVSL